MFVYKLFLKLSCITTTEVPMKKLMTAISFYLVTVLVIISCEGPAGPEGPPGPEILPISFEFTIDLLEENDFQHITEIPAQIEVFDSDMMIAYVLEDVIEEDELDVWRKLPVTEFNNNGTLLFDYDFTAVDIQIFLDANYPLGTDDEYEEVLIRAVHIPAELLNSTNNKAIENTSSVSELKQVLQSEIRELEVQRTR